MSDTEFSQFFLSDESRLEIELPDGDPMMFNGQPVVIVVYGPATEQFARAKAMQEKSATARVIAAVGNKKQKASQAADDTSDAQYLTAVTKTVENFPFPGGPLAMYSEKRLQYINHQVSKHLSDLGNFFTSSAQS